MANSLKQVFVLFSILSLVTTHSLMAQETQQPKTSTSPHLEEVLPIAPQKMDGFDGKVQSSFAPTKLESFSSQLLKKKKKKSIIPKKKGKKQSLKKKKKILKRSVEKSKIKKKTAQNLKKITKKKKSSQKKQRRRPASQ